MRRHAPSEARSIPLFTVLMLRIRTQLPNDVREFTPTMLLDFQATITNSIELQILAPVVSNHLPGPLATQPLDHAPYESG
jgi:hypothetical protein